MDRLYYISVPLNQDGIEEYDFGKEDSPNIKVYAIVEKEFDKIYETGIFDKINDSCDLLIDVYESEEIKEENLKIALGIAKNNNCEVLMQALELAIEKNTLVGLDF
ncbi:hypothetical protein [Clostridium cadaveris]|uniref:hypothetical protein n=1 Tax=Clostridium cadaveris TaxID=1529 RepID=UPI00040781A5|nr:hypothetical protein [Clostridium cadaveris]MDM8313138.1 hypothetical protein [Clostridium cadaveris]